jgi:antitoxin CcdA
MNTLALNPSISRSSKRTTKRPVNLTLSDDLVRQARNLTPNLSAVVEMLLAGYVQQHGQTLAARRKEADEMAQVLNEFNDLHGSFADEHCTF